MLIKHRFDYTPLERIDHPSGRKYMTNGVAVPSVTTILSATKDSSGIEQWINSVGVAEAERIKLEASTLGSAMHDNLEKYILGQSMSGQYMSKLLANVIIKHGLPKVDEVWGTEVAVFSEGFYAGTTDLVGLHAGTPAIMDFKNSLKDKKKEWIEDYFMQLCAYAIAHNEMFGTDIKKGVVMIATRAGKYQEFIIEGAEFIHYETMWANKVCQYYDKHR